MTKKQKRFADEYIIDLNATRAYRAAYSGIKSDEVARKAGSRLLTNVDIRLYIDGKIAEISDRKVAKAQEVMEYLTSVLRGEETEEVVVVEGCGDGRSTAIKMDKGICARDKLKAAELIGKRYGLFTDKVQLDGPALVQVIDDIPGDADEQA